MEQQTGSKLGKEYIKAIYCHLAYLTAGVQVQQPGIQPEEMDGVGDKTAS